MSPSSRECNAEAVYQADGSFAVAFRLTNHGKSDETIEYFEPFVAFQVRPLAPHQGLTVVQPPFMSPTQPRSLSIPSGGEVSLMTPIRLKLLAPGQAANTDDPFLWSVTEAPPSLELAIALGLPAPYALECRVNLNR